MAASRAAADVLWALGIAEALSILSVVTLCLVGQAWRRVAGDVLFVEGAMLLVAAGVLDLGRSITVRHIRALSQPLAAPPTPTRPGRLVILVIAGLLLCGQGFLLAHFLAPGPG